MLYFYRYYSHESGKDEIHAVRADNPRDADSFAGNTLLRMGLDLNAIGEIPEEKLRPLLNDHRGSQGTPDAPMRGVGGYEEGNIVAALRYAALEYGNIPGVSKDYLFHAATVIENSLMERIGVA